VEALICSWYEKLKGCATSPYYTKHKRFQKVHKKTIKSMPITGAALIAAGLSIKTAAIPAGAGVGAGLALTGIGAPIAAPVGVVIGAGGYILGWGLMIAGIILLPTPT
jgi:hypothetical protein